MDAIGNIVLFVWGFASRAEFVGLYALLLGLICLAFGLRSALKAEGYSFGFKGSFVINDEAIHVGQAWVVLGLLLLVLGWAALAL